MPLNASNGLFALNYTVLPARFPAAGNPLRIPKVIDNTARDRALRTALFTALLPLLCRPRRYPC